MQELIEVLDLSMRAKSRKRVYERVQACKCLQCESVSVLRGLCRQHLNEYYYLRRGMTARQAALYEAKLLRSGLILRGHDREFRKSRSKQREIANEVVRSAS